MNVIKKFFILLIIFIIIFLNLNFKKKSKLKKEYKVIIAYFNGKPEEATEDWSFFLMDIENAFKEYENFYLLELFKGDSTMIVIEENKKQLLEINIKKYLKNESGYIFIQNNKDLHWENYSPSFIIIENAEKYFE